MKKLFSKTLLALFAFAIFPHASFANPRVTELSDAQIEQVRKFQLAFTHPSDAANMRSPYYDKSFALSEFEKLNCEFRILQLVRTEHSNGSFSSQYEVVHKIELKPEFLDRKSNSFLIRRTRQTGGGIFPIKYVSDAIRIGFVDSVDEGRRSANLQIEVKFNLALGSDPHLFWSAYHAQPVGLLQSASLKEGQSTARHGNFSIGFKCKNKKQNQEWQLEGPDYLDELFPESLSSPHSTLE